MSSEHAFLAAASAIGRRIVSDAVWDGGRCNWIGADLSLSRFGLRFR